MQTQIKKELIYYLTQRSRATNWEVSPYSAVRKTIHLFPPHPYNVPSSRITTLFISTFQRSILSFYPPINSLFVLSAFVVLCLAKQTKRTTLGHCYTPGDQAATWSKIANEGGASRRKRYTDRKVLTNRPVTVFLSSTATRASQVFEDS